MSPARRLSTSLRVALTLSLTLAAGVIVLSAAAYLLVSERLSADIDRALLREADAFSAALRRDISPEADLRQATRAYISARAGGVPGSGPVLLVRFADGHVISNSDARLESADANRPALLAERSRRAFVDLAFDEETYRAATVPVADGKGRVVAVFEAAMPTSPARRVLTELLATLATAGAAVALLGCILSLAVARAALSPLRRVSETAARVTRSSLGERIDYRGPDDEVGALVRSLNSMLDRLERAFSEQRRFVADASHELRTPLAVISGHLELLADDELTEQERDEEMALVRDETDRMGRLIDEMLALARLDAGRGRPFQPVDLATLTEEASARARGLGDMRVELDAPSPVWVLGDPDRLMQALLNLIANAFTHGRVGGSVRLSARSLGDEAILEVADDGPGIPADAVSRLFDRFYRGKGSRANGGSGLGLAVTKRLVELHDGRIVAHNGADGGAVFSVILPRIPRP